jgi:hypothetical protein
MRAAPPARRLVPLALLAAAALTACGDEGSKVAPAVSASAAPTGPVLDGKLGEAAKDLAKGAEKPASSAAASGDGPPPNGMFPPGGADRAHAPGAPPKVELMGDGSEPRLQLGATRPEGKQEAVLVVAVSSGKQQALPPLALRLSIGPRADKKKAAGADLAGAAAKPKGEAVEVAAPPGETLIIAEITEAAVAGMPAGQIPPQLGEAIAKLKGSTVSWPLGPTGPGRIDHKLAAGAEEGLDIALEAVEESLGALLVPTPDKPVGEGATWMVTDRTSSMGIDGVRYRFVKVEDVDGDRATLGVTIRKYAASDRLDLPLGPQMSTASLDAIDAQGKSTIKLVPRTWVPDEGEVSSRLMAQLAPPGGKNPQAQQPQQRAQVQLEVAAQLRSPAALAAAARQNGAAPPDAAAAPAPRPRNPAAAPP